MKIAAPDREGAQHIAPALYDEIHAAYPWDACFAADLGTAALEVLSRASPRTMRRALINGFGVARLEARDIRLDAGTRRQPIGLRVSSGYNAGEDRLGKGRIVMSDLQAKAADLVERFMQESVSAGLTWDEAVVVFGLAAKAAATAAATAGEGPAAECVSYARQRLDEAFSQDVRVVIADTRSGSQHETGHETNVLPATAHRRRNCTLH